MKKYLLSMLEAFYAIFTLLILQGVFSLIEGLRFRAFVRKSILEPGGSFTPSAVVIAPCKGVDPGLEDNIRALLTLDYPDYELIFAIALSEDPSRSIIQRLIEEHPATRARIVVAGRSGNRSEKVHNLLAALQEVGPDVEALVFVDLDARVPPDWLRSLVAPLIGSGVGASTGYRWYVPERGGFWSALLSAWNGSVATTLGDHGRNFAWGGGTGILRETFQRIGVQKRWASAVSDDYALTRAVQEAGLRVWFEPRCLVASLGDTTLKSLIEFTNRQVIITRVYRPRVWWTGLISQLLFCAGFFGGIALVAVRASSGRSVAAFIVALAAIYSLGSIKGWLRIESAAQVLPELQPEIRRLWWMFCFLWPLVSILFMFNFVTSAMTRRITWRGVSYEMRSASETIVIR